MAIVTCESCGRWLYRPDEMTGKEWECLFCGNTKSTEACADVPEQLARLLEEEYKRIVWNMIYPGSDSVSRVPPSPPGRPQPPPLLLQEVNSIARKRLRAGEGMRGPMVSALWALLLTTAAVFLVLLLMPKESQSRPFVVIAICFALLTISIAIGGFSILFLLARVRRHRLGRIDKTTAAARAPTSRNQPAQTVRTDLDGIQAEPPNIDRSQAVTPEPD